MTPHKVLSPTKFVAFLGQEAHWGDGEVYFACYAMAMVACGLVEHGAGAGMDPICPHPRPAETI